MPFKSSFLSNIMLQAAFAADIIEPLVQLLQTAEFDIKKEAAWAISNATPGGTHEHIKYDFLLGCFLFVVLFPPDYLYIVVRNLFYMFVGIL